MESDVCRLLDEIQRDIDEEHLVFARRDFECKLEHHKAIRPLLLRRDSVISEALLEMYWGRALAGFDAARGILPRDGCDRISTQWMRSLVAEYLDGYGYRVHIELNENEFVSNKTLTKRVDLSLASVEKTGVVWRGNRRYPVFEFFESDTQDLDMFDILYELYVNSASYFLMSSRSHPMP
ncbi:hypothetical protein M970_010030 [Encephalitozoon cuniculi EcunIII-L]|uniref:NAP/SET family protein n=1 Tax=Encephalitozoon cuniculi TaxID=6035 RepID=M1KA71_ENCCN|nr:NAP/SET family protein [Encephalitozoon cuniculi]KMV66675.1 hypothetical protein M970_010030 [Encephalitozoon cuniculi EcunIII-L]UYI28389.1 putative nucleosome assembly protein [Encephalitozoon cuniculi]UYI28515.1 putative nucleosome assembly protein [Encephalitozoon cuniculi]